MNRLRPVGQRCKLTIFVSMLSLALVQACKQSTPEQPKAATPKTSANGQNPKHHQGLGGVWGFERVTD